MTKKEKIDYWIKSAEYDWEVAGHLLEKGDYPYALFFGHLTIEPRNGSWIKVSIATS